MSIFKPVPADGAQAWFRKTEGQLCIACRRPDALTDLGPFECDRDNAAFTLTRRCNNCGATWIEHFHLLGFTQTVPPRHGPTIRTTGDPESL